MRGSDGEEDGPFEELSDGERDIARKSTRTQRAHASIAFRTPEEQGGLTAAERKDTYLYILLLYIIY
jgi:hypothetical protein